MDKGLSTIMGADNSAENTPNVCAIENALLLYQKRF